MVDTVAPQRTLTPAGVSVALGVLAALVLGYGWWSTSQTIAVLDKRMAAFEGSVGAIPDAADLQKLRDEQAALSKKVDAVSVPDVSALSGDLATLKSAVAAIETRLPAAPADPAQVIADLAELKTSVAVLRAQIGDLTPQSLTALTTQVSELAATMPAAPADDNAQLTTMVAALGGQIEGLRAQIGDLSPAKLAALQASVGGLDDKVAALSGSIGGAASASDLSALQTRLDALAKSMPATDIVPLGADIDALKSRIANLEASGTADSSTVAALKTQLQELTARFGAVETTSSAVDVAALKTDLANLQSQMAMLDKGKDIAGLQAAVRELQLKPAVQAVKPKVLAQIYFARGSYQLADADNRQLADLAKDLIANPREVAIMGFSDTQGPVEFNRTLSLRRASAVRKALIGFGVDTSTVTALTGLGEDGPPIGTDDGTPEPGNRTVLVLASN